MNKEEILKKWKCLEDIKIIAHEHKLCPERIRQIVKEQTDKKEYKMYKKLRSELRRSEREKRRLIKYYNK